ncbi:uncharacterized protein LOC142163366 [Nicotiana tabacum]|uniref:Uncharacterized protein LOC142163366 n=1 Tax=Nicotiana tabacum TaxID=4097 RepID=A0AC58RVI5_TOBAC
MPLDDKEIVLVSETTLGVWTLFMDGVSNVKGSWLEVVLVTSSGETLRPAIKTVLLTNNEAEYEALVAGIELAQGLGFEVIEFKCPYQNIGKREVVDFLWDHIICRLGIPKEFPCENGPQFIGSKIIKILEYLKIKRIKSSTYHLSANGQAESTNKVIIQNLKKSLEAAKGKWLEELPSVLWAYRTTLKSSMGEMPFSLVYGAKVVIPVEVEEPSSRFSQANKEANNEALLVKLYLLNENRELAYVRTVAQKQRMERHFNRRANLCYFKVGDLVLRKMTQSTQEINAGKLDPKWEGP